MSPSILKTLLPLNEITPKSPMFPVWTARPSYSTLLFSHTEDSSLPTRYKSWRIWTLAPRDSTASSTIKAPCSSSIRLISSTLPGGAVEMSYYDEPYIRVDLECSFQLFRSHVPTVSLCRWTQLPRLHKRLDSPWHRKSYRSRRLSC